MHPRFEWGLRNLGFMIPARFPQVFNKAIDLRQSGVTRLSCIMPIGCVTMMLSEAKKFHAYARECLQLAEQATEPDIRKSLIDLSRIWMEAAVKEERHIFSNAI